MSENERISILIPVYNVEKYIERCFDSILKQKYTNFEVICVDDGSTDTSGKICDEYQKKDGRIKVFHIENHGVGYARNYALSLMEGSWFCFIDPDDWIEPEYLSRMYELAVKNECVLVACGVKKTYEYDVEKEKTEEQIYLFESAQECIHNFICTSHSMQGISTNKLYSSDMFKNERFNTELKVNEDCLFIYEIMSKCSRACLTTLPLYHWFIRPDSACHKRPEEANFSAANVFALLHDRTLQENDEEITRTLQKNYITSAVQVLLFARYASTNVEVIAVKKQCKEWRKNVWSILGSKNKLKYLCAIYGPHFKC